MKKFSLLSVALLWVASHAAGQFKSTSLVPLLQKEALGLNIAAKTPAKAKAKVPSAPILDRPEGTSYDVMGSIDIVMSANSQPSVSTYSRTSEIVDGNDGFVYIKNLPNLVGAGTYVQAERGQNDTISIKKQLVYAQSGIEYYLTLAKWDNEIGNLVELPDTTLKMIYKDGVLNSIDEDKKYTGLLIGYSYGNDATGWTFGGAEFNIKYKVNTEVKTTLPEGLTTESFVIKTIDSYTTGDAYDRINIAFTDDAVYLNVYDDAYAKGTIEGNKVTFESGQYLGVYSSYQMYFVAAYVDSIFDAGGNFVKLQAKKSDKIVFDYDKEARTLKSDSLFLVNAGKEDLLGLSLFWAPQIYPFVEVAAVPADPSISTYGEYLETPNYNYNYAMFSLYPTDVDGNYIDENKMAYRAFIDDELFVFSPEEYSGLTEDLEEVPAGYRNETGQITPSYFMFYFYPEKNVGVQSIYYGGGERHVSNIVFKDIKTGEVTVVPDTEDSEDIHSSMSDQTVTGISYADLSGRKVNANSRGMVLMTLKRADGTQKTVKVIKK